MKFSLVIPCYNEAPNLPFLLNKCKRVVKNHDIEIILVDNGSTDTSSEVLEELLPNHLGCRSIRVPQNRGYGFGILCGLNVANGEILGWTHADLQTDPNDVLKGLKLFECHGPNILVKGQRVDRPLNETVFTLGMSIFETCLLGKLMYDINAQPTMFPRAFFNTWQLPPSDFSLDLYTYYQARKDNLPVHRFPVSFGKRLYGNSHWNINWMSKWHFIQRTVHYSIKLKKSLKS